MPSGLLHDSDVKFYHPVDDFTEYTQSLDWTNVGDDFDFVSSILTSGIKTTASDSLARFVYTPGSPYVTLLNASGATCAFWASGFLGSDSDDRQIYVGFANTSNSFREGLILDKTTSSSGFRFGASANNVSRVLNWTPPPSNDTDWHLFIMDMRYETSGWRHRISLDGNDWINLGVDDNSATFSTNPRPIIIVFDHTTSPKIPIDEVVLWGDNNLFTTQELSNLYELYNTYNITMDQYTSTFGIPVNSGIDCFVRGHTQTSGNISLYIPGQKETKLIDLFIEGFIQISGNIDLYISGTPSIASSSIDLYLEVATPTNDNISLYTVGPLSIDNNTDDFIRGYQILSDNIDQYIQGYQSISGNINLYIPGTIPVSSSTSLYIIGPILISGNVNDLIIGHLPISGNFSLFIRSGLDIDAFVRVSENTPTDNVDLFVHGVPSGVSTTYYTNNTIALFINDNGDVNTVDSNWYAFTKVDDASGITYSGTWQSFVKGGNTINNDVNLYINSHISGDIIHGILISGLFTTFINGLSIQSDDDEGLLSDGYSIGTLETSGFARVHSGVVDTFNFYISGTIPIVPPLATLNLFTFGILGITSDSNILYISSKESVNDNYNLFIFGIQDIESGNIPLYLKVTTLGLLNRESDLYAHGF